MELINTFIFIFFTSFRRSFNFSRRKSNEALFDNCEAFIVLSIAVCPFAHLLLIRILVGLQRLLANTDLLSMRDQVYAFELMA